MKFDFDWPSGFLSAVFKLWMLCFQRISFQIIERSQQLSLCRVAALKSLPVYRYCVVIFTFSGP